MELHVFIEVTAPIPEAYMRMAHAMDEVKKFLIPVRTEGLKSYFCSMYEQQLIFFLLVVLQEPGEHEPYMDPHFLNGSQDVSGRGRGLGRGRGGPPGAGGPR